MTGLAVPTSPFRLTRTAVPRNTTSFSPTATNESGIPRGRLANSLSHPRSTPEECLSSEEVEYHARFDVDLAGTTHCALVVSQRHRYHERRRRGIARASVAVHDTVVEPTGNSVPDAGRHRTGTTGSRLSVAVGDV